MKNITLMLEKNYRGRLCLYEVHPYYKSKSAFVIKFTKKTNALNIAWGKVNAKNFEWLKANDAVFWEGLYFIDYESLWIKDARWGTSMKKLHKAKLF